MSVNDLVLVQGMADTRLALDRWNREPLRVLGPWLLLSLLITLALLGAIYLVASATVPTATRYLIPGYNDGAGFADYLHVLLRNGLVLALHAARLRGRLHRRQLASSVCLTAQRRLALGA